MFKYNCLNPIAAVGLDLFSDQYEKVDELKDAQAAFCLLYTSPSPRDGLLSRMPSSA